MKTPCRYLLIVSCVAFLALCYFGGGHRLKGSKFDSWWQRVRSWAWPDNSRTRTSSSSGDRLGLSSSVFSLSGGSVASRNEKFLAGYKQWKGTRRRYYEEDEEEEEGLEKIPEAVMNVNSGECRMETCFNFGACEGGPPFKHYIYPLDDRLRISENYRKVLSVLRASPFYTADPSQACLFILSLDTLNRDPLSDQEFVRNLPTR